MKFIFLIGTLYAVFVATIPIVGGFCGLFVWENGFDYTVAGCDREAFFRWNSTHDPQCFTPTWGAEDHRQWLWDTCNLPGSIMSAVFLQGVDTRLQTGYNKRDCDHADIQLVKYTMKEAHENVAGIAIYALLAFGAERNTDLTRTRKIVWYNDKCAGPDEAIDGLAIKITTPNSFQCSEPPQRYLQRLQKIVDEAAKQESRILKTHVSIEPTMGKCGVNDNHVTWNGRNLTLSKHLIEMFDSTDVQVETTDAYTARKRLRMADADYAKSLGKTMYVVARTTPDFACENTFFPSECNGFDHTAGGMKEFFMNVTSSPYRFVIPCIDGFRAVYSSGVVEGWPAYTDSVQPEPEPESEPEPEPEP